MFIKQFIIKNYVEKVHYMTMLLTTLYFIFYYLDYKNSNTVLLIHIFLWAFIIGTVFISLNDHKKIKKSKKQVDIKNMLEETLTLSTLFKNKKL